MATSYSSLHFCTFSKLSSVTKPKVTLPSSSYKPITASFEHYTSWARVNNEVEAHIQHVLAGKQPTSIYEPMSHLIVEVPRSMAPALCIAACEVVGGDKEKAIPAASALHLMHIATYTHEYLQLSEQSIPWPIMDMLLAAMEEQPDINPDHILRVMVEIGRAMGSEGLVYGQYLKMRSMGLVPDEPCEEGTIYEAFERKGGALYSCGAACGAILGGGSDEEIEKLRRYGLYVGMIHNIMIHDVLGRDKKLLKLADSLRFLALKELEGMKDKNIEKISGIIDGFSAFLRPSS
ncbi:hypothetical protein ACHQM5_004014 [Ranunculus cassubicifolius]